MLLSCLKKKKNKRKMKILWLIFGFFVIKVSAEFDNNSTKNLIFVYGNMEPVMKFDEFVRNTYIVLHYQNSNINKTVFICFATQTDVLVREIAYHVDYSIFKTRIDEIRKEKRIESPMKALLKSLQFSSPNSLIFVFTIAHPEDSSVLGDILDMIEIKKIEVGFALEWNHFPEIPDEYQNISYVGNGIIIDKTSEAFNFISSSLRNYPRKVNLLTVNSDKFNKYNISIDNFVNSEIVVSIPKAYQISTDMYSYITSRSSFIGNQSKTEIIRPRSSSSNPISLHISPPGYYSLESRTQLVRIFGYSDINFSYGFATSRVTSIRETSPRPTLDVPNYIYVQPTSLDYKTELQYCEIIAPNGDTVDKIFLHRVNQSNLFYGLFDPSLKIYFYLRITAIVYDQQVQRMSSNGISSVDRFAKESKPFCSKFEECLIWYALFSGMIFIALISILVISCVKSAIVKYRDTMTLEDFASSAPIQNDYVRCSREMN